MCRGRRCRGVWCGTYVSQHTRRRANQVIRPISQQREHVVPSTRRHPSKGELDGKYGREWSLSSSGCCRQLVASSGPSVTVEGLDEQAELEHNSDEDTVNVHAHTPQTRPQGSSAEAQWLAEPQPKLRSATKVETDCMPLCGRIATPSRYAYVMKPRMSFKEKGIS